MIAKIDADLCIGCQLCVQVAPNLFEMKEDKAITLSDTISDDQASSCKEATDSCPVNAIICE